MKDSEQSSVNSEQLKNRRHSPFTIHYSLFTDKGFTLVEILVAMTILATVMSILYSTFSTSSANAKIIEERADDLSSLTGALDIISQEVRGAYTGTENSQPAIIGKKDLVTFTTLTPFVKDDEPAVQMVSYAFDNGKLTRKTFQGIGTETKSESVLLEGIKEPSFSFFNGKEWLEEWPSGSNLPFGLKVAFSYKSRDAATVVPILSARK